MKTKPMLTFILACAIHAHGEVLFDSFGSANSFATNHPDMLGSGFRLAVAFAPTTPVVLDRITVAMSHVMGSDIIRLTVQPDAAGVPGEAVLDTIELGGFPTIPECVLIRSCNLNSAGPETVQTSASTSRPLLHAGNTYWIVAQTVAPEDLLAWHGGTAGSSPRAYDIGQGWTADLEGAYALRIEGALIPSIEELMALVNESSPTQRQKRPLMATLEAAVASLAGNDCEAGVNQLHAFQNKVRAQVAGSDAAMAEALIALAQDIIKSACR